MAIEGISKGNGTGLVKKASNQKSSHIHKIIRQGVIGTTTLSFDYTTEQGQFIVPKETKRKGRIKTRKKMVSQSCGISPVYPTRSSARTVATLKFTL